MGENLLLVEPDCEILEAFKSFLHRNGYLVTIAASGRECLDRLSVSIPDLMVLEPALPGLWGDRVLATCCDLVRSTKLPVIAVSRRNPGMHSFPFKAYHIKPISLNALLHSIEASL